MEDFGLTNLDRSHRLFLELLQFGRIPLTSKVDATRDQNALSSQPPGGQKTSRRLSGAEAPSPSLLVVNRDSNPGPASGGIFNPNH